MSKGKLKLGLQLKVNELGEVKSREEILATLDEHASLDGLPFMPEMFRYCGKQFRVYKSAHKTCDTVHTYKSRKMENAVHLDTRCDGAAHGGCQASCLIFWKEAWLKRVNTNVNGYGSTQNKKSVSRQAPDLDACTEDDVWKAATATIDGKATPTYVCQATRLPYATTELNWWNLGQYFEDYRSRNVGISTILKGLIYKSCYFLNHAGIGLGPLIRWFYNSILPLWGGTPWPLKIGPIPKGQPTPTKILNLQPGELVRVKPYEEILRTVNKKNMNRGMSFDKEMVPYCGGVYRVLKRVNKLINEKTGEMQEMKNPCIVLDTVVCQSRYSECRLFCPRSIYSFWREIWLERLPESAAVVAEATSHQATKPIGCEVPEGAWQASAGTLHEQQAPSAGVQPQ